MKILSIGTSLAVGHFTEGLVDMWEMEHRESKDMANSFQARRQGVRGAHAPSGAKKVCLMGSQKI